MLIDWSMANKMIINHQIIIIYIAFKLINKIINNARREK